MIPEIAAARTVGFDTCILIYYIEANGKYLELVKPLFEAFDNHEKTGITSYLTLLEVLVKPLQMEKNELAAQYRDILLSSAGLSLYSVDEQIAEEAASIRAFYGFKTPDSIQLAVAKLRGANLFLTNDRDLSDFEGLAVIILDDYITH